MSTVKSKSRGRGRGRGRTSRGKKHPVENQEDTKIQLEMDEDLRNAIILSLESRKNGSVDISLFEHENSLEKKSEEMKAEKQNMETLSNRVESMEEGEMKLRMELQKLVQALDDQEFNLRKNKEKLEISKHTYEEKLKDYGEELMEYEAKKKKISDDAEIVRTQNEELAAARKIDMERDNSTGRKTPESEEISRETEIRLTDVEILNVCPNLLKGTKEDNRTFKLRFPPNETHFEIENVSLDETIDNLTDYASCKFGSLVKPRTGFSKSLETDPSKTLREVYRDAGWRTVPKKLLIEFEQK